MNRTEYREATERYITALSTLNKSTQTITGYTRILRAFGEWFESTDHLGDISPLDIEEYRSTLREAKPSTIKHYLTVLSYFFSWCVRKGITDNNPVHADAIPEAEQKEYDLLTAEEISALINGGYVKRERATNAARNRAIVVLLLTSGMRNSELRSLTVSDLDFAKCIITVKHGKGDKRRAVPFPRVAQDAVAEYLGCGCRPSGLKETDLLFGSDASSEGAASQNRTEWHELSSTALLLIVNRYTKAVCGHEVGVHTLRHAAASYWDDKGISMRDVQTALGHASVTTTERIYVTVLNRTKAAQCINSVYPV